MRQDVEDYQVINWRDEFFKTQRAFIGCETFIAIWLAIEAIFAMRDAYWWITIPIYGIGATSWIFSAHNRHKNMKALEGFK